MTITAIRSTKRPAEIPAKLIEELRAILGDKGWTENPYKPLGRAALELMKLT